MPGRGKGASSRGGGAWSRGYLVPGIWSRGGGWSGGLGCPVQGGGYLVGRSGPGGSVWRPPPTATAAGVLLECILSCFE